MAHITCLYFYDVAISPVEHHTNITALAETQKTADITTKCSTHKKRWTNTWTPITQMHVLLKASTRVHIFHCAKQEESLC